MVGRFWLKVIISFAFTKMYNRLSRCSTDRGCNAGLFHVGPTEVKAGKSFLFTEGSQEVFIKITCTIYLSHFVIKS